MRWLLLLFVFLLAVGICLLWWRRHERDMSGRRSDGSVRFYNPEQFSPMPLMPRRQVPIPVRSKWWQLGMALVLYPSFGICALGVVWFFQQLP